MADWQEVGGGGDTEMWNREGSIEGVYVSSKSNVGPNDSMVYTIRTKDGTIGVWGSTVLDSKFEQISTGSEVRVTSLGKAKSQRGTEYYDYKVEVKPNEGVEKVKDTLGGEVI